MVFGLGKREEPAPAQQVVRPTRLPTDKVLEMRAQGVSNNQIIQLLQREGYDLTAIFNAMNQADVKSGIDYGELAVVPKIPPGGSTMANQMQPEQEFYPQHGAGLPEAPQYPGVEQDFGMQQPMAPGPGAFPAGPGTPFPQQPEMEQMQYPQGPAPAGYEAQRIEELAEAIIDEKWNEIVRSINKIIDWKERVEARVTKMEQQLDDMQRNFDMLHKGVLGKISDYDQNLQNVGAEIKAMDKVFQKVLPSLTESVSELGRITTGMRKK
jgi:uncharacterized protein (DUF433 family)